MIILFQAHKNNRVQDRGNREEALNVGSFRMLENHPRKIKLKRLIWCFSLTEFGALNPQPLLPNF